MDPDVAPGNNPEVIIPSLLQSANQRDLARVVDQAPNQLITEATEPQLFPAPDFRAISVRGNQVPGQAAVQ